MPKTILHRIKPCCLLPLPGQYDVYQYLFYSYTIYNFYIHVTKKNFKKTQFISTKYAKLISSKQLSNSCASLGYFYPPMSHFRLCLYNLRDTNGLNILFLVIWHAWSWCLHILLNKWPNTWLALPSLPSAYGLLGFRKLK